MTAKRTSSKHHQDTYLGVRAIATQLNLAHWQVRLALDTGLLPVEERNKVNEKHIRAAEANKEKFLADLEAVTPVNLTEAARLLGVTTARAKKAIEATKIPVVKTETWRHGTVIYWRKGDITGKTADWLSTDTEGEKASQRGKAAAATRMKNNTRKILAKREERIQAETAQRERQQRIDTETYEALTVLAETQHMNIRILTHTPGPETVTIHAGPTNSGKTYQALNALSENGRGVYAGPLRMLAREAYEKLCLLNGEENVGLVTGEEQVNPDAPIICSTAEAAPVQHGGILVLDECHWMSDPQRGWAWTRLLISGLFQHVHAITDPAAADLVQRLIPDARTSTIIYHPRLSHIKYAGRIPVEKMPDGSAIVAFSRASVLAIANILSNAGRKPAVLYGALPPIARIAQINRLISGDADIIVTTDVIGHGINLPLTAVALAETQKYDGVSRRSLYRWEAAQILGRAGRFGQGTEVGLTYSVTGEKWFSSYPALIETATSAAGGHISTEWSIPDRAPVRPTLGELTIQNPEELPDAVRAFAVTTEQASSRLPIQPFDDSLVQERLAVILPLLRSNRHHTIPIELIWGLTMCPIDDMELISTVTGVLLGYHKPLIAFSEYVAKAQVRNSSPLTVAEQAAAIARNLRAVTLSVGNLPGVTVADAAKLEHLAGEAVVRALSRKDATVGYGTCSRCGESCPPWFPTCQDCHRSSSRTSWDRGTSY